MTTLKELLIKNDYNISYDDYGTQFNEAELITSIVKEWLQQKQQHHICDDCFCCINILLEELK